jgi:hypothetical protein
MEKIIKIAKIYSIVVINCLMANFEGQLNN